MTRLVKRRCLLPLRYNNLLLPRYNYMILCYHESNVQSLFFPSFPSAPNMCKLKVSSTNMLFGRSFANRIHQSSHHTSITADHCGLRTNRIIHTWRGFSGIYLFEKVTFRLLSPSSFDCFHFFVLINDEQFFVWYSSWILLRDFT